MNRSGQRHAHRGGRITRVHPLTVPGSPTRRVLKPHSPRRPENAQQIAEGVLTQKGFPRSNGPPQFFPPRT